MSTRRILVVPRDLLERIVSSKERTGRFSGLKLKGEHVFIAVQSSLGNEEITSANARLLPHRASNYTLGSYKDELLKWVVVETDFHKKYRRAQTLSADEYQRVVGIDIVGEQLWFAAIEPSDEGAILTTKTATQVDGGIRLVNGESTILEDAAIPFARLPEKMVEDLHGKSVMVVGVGSGGSEIALNLACSGVGKLELVDPDRLRPENYIRFPAGKQDLGRYKVDVVRSMVQERELPTVVDVHYLDVVGDADEFRGILSSDTDLVICATDSVRSRRLVNCTTVQMNLPCIIAGTLDNGRIAEVLSVRPYASACYECVRLELGAVLDEPRPDQSPSTPYVGPEDVRGERGTLRMDIAVAAALTSHVALQLLNPERFHSMPTSYMVWGREASRQFSAPFQFEYPFATNFVPIKRRKDCSVCGALPQELVGVDVAERVRQILSEADAVSV